MVKQYRSLYKEEVQDNYLEQTITFQHYIAKALNAEHIKNNHVSWNNSGSKFLKVNSVPKQMIQILDRVPDRIKERGLGSYNGDDVKCVDLGAGIGITIDIGTQIGIDYGLYEKKHSADYKLCNNMYSKNKDSIVDIWKSQSQGLDMAEAITWKNEMFLIEKRHGNPNVTFILRIGNGSKTSKVSILGMKSQDTWYGLDPTKIWTCYPGEIPPLENPALLYVPSSRVSDQIKYPKEI